MIRPSSGVKLIVVSTERPSRTAASDAPAPRWQLTTRSAQDAEEDGPELPGPPGSTPLTASTTMTLT